MENATEAFNFDKFRKTIEEKGLKVNWIKQSLNCVNVGPLGEIAKTDSQALMGESIVGQAAKVAFQYFDPEKTSAQEIDAIATGFMNGWVRGVQAAGKGELEKFTNRLSKQNGDTVPELEKEIDQMVGTYSPKTNPLVRSSKFEGMLEGYIFTILLKRPEYNSFLAGKLLKRLNINIERVVEHMRELSTYIENAETINELTLSYLKQGAQ